MPYVVERRQSIQYDGTNGEHICGEWSGGSLTLIEDDGQTLVVASTASPEYSATAQAGDWIIAGSYSVSAQSPEAYARSWHELP
jgi:hypothetical protein